MNKDVISLYKIDTGYKPKEVLIESEMLKPRNGFSEQGVLIKKIPKKFTEFDSDTFTYTLIFPDPDYINWLEEKVNELQNLKLET